MLGRCLQYALFGVRSHIGAQQRPLEVPMFQSDGSFPAMPRDRVPIHRPVSKTQTAVTCSG